MNKERLGTLGAGFTPLLAMEEASRCLLCLDAPCSKACPAGTDPGKFIRSIRFKNYKGAAKTILTNNPFGLTCALVCPTERYCQSGCSRSGIDKPIDIAKLQRYALEYTQDLDLGLEKPLPNNGKKVAIIGSGPSGMTTASRLADLGYEVTIYEKETKAGGYLRYGIPYYRLPEMVIDYEIKRILNKGVRFVFNCRVGTDLAIDQLRKDYDAVVACIGHGKPKILPMFEGMTRAMTAIEFLRKVNLSKFRRNLPGHVLVIGGGDVAMDIVTICRKSGIKQVTDVVYETFDEFKASKSELEGARAMNVSIYDGFVPVEARSGGIVKFKHRFQDISLRIKADLVVLAIGQSPDVDGLNIPMKGQEAEAPLQHVEGNLFVAGDIAEGEKTVVYAVRTGKAAAMAVHAYLGGK